MATVRGRWPKLRYVALALVIGTIASWLLLRLPRLGKMVIQPQYDLVRDFSEGRAPVRIGVNWGFIDQTGRMIASPRFIWIDGFSEGLAATSTALGSERHVRPVGGYIDRDGHDSGIAADTCRRFSSGLAAVRERGLGYYIDPRGQKVISLSDIDGNYQFGDFSEGLAAIARQNDTWRYIDTNGDVVIEVPFEYDHAVGFHDGVAVAHCHEKWMWTDEDGIEMYSYSQMEGGKRTSGWLLIRARNGAYSMMRLGTDYRQVMDFSCGLAAVENDKGEWGYIEPNLGAEVVKCHYDEASRFSEGLAAVRSGQLWGFIDTNGRVVIPFRYSGARAFSQGLAAVEAGGKWASIGRRYERTDSMPVWYRLGGGKWGYIDRKGELRIPFRYTDVRDFAEGMAAVCIDGKWGFISRGRWEPR